MSRGYHRRLERSIGVDEAAKKQSPQEDRTLQHDTTAPTSPPLPDPDGSFSGVQEGAQEE